MTHRFGGEGWSAGVPADPTWLHWRVMQPKRPAPDAKPIACGGARPILPRPEYREREPAAHMRSPCPARSDTRSRDWPIAGAARTMRRTLAGAKRMKCGMIKTGIALNVLL